MAAAASRALQEGDERLEVLREVGIVRWEPTSEARAAASPVQGRAEAGVMPPADAADAGVLEPGLQHLSGPVRRAVVDHHQLPLRQRRRVQAADSPGEKGGAVERGQHDARHLVGSTARTSRAEEVQESIGMAVEDEPVAGGPDALAQLGHLTALPGRPVGAVQLMQPPHGRLFEAPPRTRDVTDGEGAPCNRETRWSS